ncbi:MAG: hypothetical protein IIC99_11545 [Chloroflexi bacterium]|nr:hypothetical protein [Chloroflexota bacterium]
MTTFDDGPERPIGLQAYSPDSPNYSAPLPKKSTGLESLDGLLGGGIFPRSLVILAGAPGTGKSILGFHMMAQAVLEGASALLVSTTLQPIAKLREQYAGLTFLGPTGVFDAFELLDLDPDVPSEALNRILNSIVQRVQEKNVGMAVIDSFRAISDIADSRRQIWRFLGTLSAQLVEHDFVAVLVGEYDLPKDLDLPEFAMADLVIYLETDRQVSADVRTLRIYKMRGGRFTEGRHAFEVGEDGIQFIGAYQIAAGPETEDQEPDAEGSLGNFPR